MQLLSFAELLMYLVEQFANIIVIEWQMPTKKGIEYNTARPYIRCRPIVRDSLFIFQKVFRGLVIQGVTQQQ